MLLAQAAHVNKRLSMNLLLTNLYGYDVSPTTVWRVLKAAGYKKTKPTRKPGLTKKMRQDRLTW
ncbi:HTH-Tnp-Tc3-2 multi-domain protein, partial [Pyrenophora tritici-repentis]